MRPPEYDSCDDVASGGDGGWREEGQWIGRYMIEKEWEKQAWLRP